MADGVTVQVRGLADLHRAIEGLTADLRKRVIKGALRDAARPILRAAKAGAPVLDQATKYRTPGVVRDNVRVFASKLRKAAQGEFGTFVTVRVPASKRRVIRRVARLRRSGVNIAVKNDPFYFRFLEAGTQKMAARPFLGPAFQAHKDAALRLFETAVARRIEAANRIK